jgi:hypothetical protein
MYTSLSPARQLEAAMKARSARLLTTTLLLVLIALLGFAVSESTFDLDGRQLHPVFANSGWPFEILRPRESKPKLTADARQLLEDIQNDITSGTNIPLKADGDVDSWEPITVERTSEAEPIVLIDPGLNYNSLGQGFMVLPNYKPDSAKFMIEPWREGSARLYGFQANTEPLNDNDDTPHISVRFDMESRIIEVDPAEPK